MHNRIFEIIKQYIKYIQINKMTIFYLNIGDINSKLLKIVDAIA